MYRYECWREVDVSEVLAVREWRTEGRHFFMAMSDRSAKTQAGKLFPEQEGSWKKGEGYWWKSQPSLWGVARLLYI